MIQEPGEPVQTVGLTEPVDPAHAPIPSNDSERLLFRQMYETLVAIDCNGRAVPALAASWRLDPDGRTWIVALRQGASFSDGTPVKSADVRAAWMRGAADDFHPRVNRLLESVVRLDDTTLAITLVRPHADAPLPLAHPDLAIARPLAGSHWPLGTRGTRIPNNVERPGASGVLTMERDGLLPLRFLVAPADPRDRLDHGVDLLLTRDPAALHYAATLPGYQSIPMPWQRTHVLLTPTGTPPLSDEARQALADEGVRGEARGAMPPFWWQAPGDCRITHTGRGDRRSPTPRIVYDAADSPARDLAERLVGLGRYARASGLAGDALARARRTGGDAAYVAALDRPPLEPCRDLQVLVEHFPWVNPDTIVPLVDTRLQSVVRRGRSGLIAEWDGGLLIESDDAR